MHRGRWSDYRGGPYSCTGGGGQIIGGGVHNHAQGEVVRL